MSEVGEHLRRTIDADDAVAPFGQQVGNSSRAAAQLQDRGPRSDGTVDDRGFPRRRNARLDLDRAAVVGDRAVAPAGWWPRRATDAHG
ncbi:MAG: hypothetical protein WBG36_02330 [Ornithinimicrobium sp.]